jgi:hypothetical protein
MDIFSELIKIFIHIVVPTLAAIVFFALAKFARHIMPLRALVSSVQTYETAFWGFLLFGFYLLLRPIQVLAGPHPRPLIFSTLREFLLLGLFSPMVFVSLLTLCFGPKTISRKVIVSVFAGSIFLAVVFCLINAAAIGGSKEIVKLGIMTAYDGLWYESGHPQIGLLMKTLFFIRLLNPGLLLTAAALCLYYHARHYPPFKAKLYDNMPRKLKILSAATFIYALSLIIGSLVYGPHKVPDQWGLHHFVALIAGFLEAFSISLPVRKDVQVSEHEEVY